MEAYDRMRRDMARRLAEKGIDDAVILEVLDEVTGKYDVSMRETGSGNGSDVLEDYISCCEYEKMAAGTIQNYRLVIGRLLKTLDMPIQDIRTSDLRTYLRNYQEERGVSDRTINKYREYIRAFWSWMCNEGYTVRNPAAELREIRCEKKQKEAFTQTELEYIRQACGNVRDAAIIEVLYSTGCRVSELCGLKKSDVDWNNKTGQIFGKGKKRRASYLNAKAEVHLREYLDSRTDDSEYLFISRRGVHGMTPAGIQKVLRDMGKALGGKVGKSVTPHVFRHTTATQALRSGMPVEDIQALLGHANIETTMVYARTCAESVQANHKKYVV